MILRLLSYNIRFGGHGREETIAETIVAPDIASSNGRDVDDA